MKSARQAILALTLLSSSAQSHAATPQAPLQLNSPALPNGRLLAVSHVGNYFAFVVIDSLVRRGSTADVWFYEIIYPPMPLGKRLITQDMVHQWFDCAGRTREEIEAWAYDDKDGEVTGVSEPTRSPIPPGAREDLRSRFICDGMKLDLEVVGRKQAAALAQQILRSGH